MTHASVPADKRAELGITDGLVRISAGIEDLADLLADTEQALAWLEKSFEVRGEGPIRMKTDPEFDPGESAFYYVRVLENPVCRYSQRDALARGVPHPDGLPQTIQERAWSSPIWHTPPS